MFKKIMLLSSALVATAVQATPFLGVADPTPHFFVQMENRTAQNVGISFQLDAGEASLAPTLENKTLLPAHQMSATYGVVYPHLGANDVFSIVFTGKQDCAYKVEFLAPGDPKITISGLGCYGGGYAVNGHTLLLYVSDIHQHPKL